jgi:nucleotide-binding universal stress UspA family protein
MKAIVVGVDGSHHAESALAFAAEEAALRKARLIVVCAWDMPMSLVQPMGSYAPEVFEGLAESSAEIVKAAVAQVAVLQPLVACEGKTVEGHPAEVLVQEAERADMIVVGSRGRGGFANLLLGSVTQQVVHHASCPVVVVR